jgi:hypothetical protein
LNAELQYRLELLRTLDRRIGEIERAQSHLQTSAWTRAMAWGCEWVIRGARESIKEKGPLPDKAQMAELAEFVRSLEKTTTDFPDRTDGTDGPQNVS